MLVGCNATTTSNPSSKNDEAGSDSAGPAIREMEDATASVGEAAATDAWPWDAAPVPEDATGYAPPMACDMDASPEASVTECPPPISVCDNAQQQLVYFDWGQCVAGWCSWPQMTTPCPYGCASGRCFSAPTAKLTVKGRRQAS